MSNADSAQSGPGSDAGHSPNTSARPGASKYLVPILKVVVAGGLLYYAFVTKMDENALNVLRRILFESPSVLALAIATFAIQIIIGAQRLRILLAAKGVIFSYWNMLRLAYLGAFFDTFMLTSVGGDAVKAIYLARETQPGRKLEAVSVLVLDRLMGLLGLLTLMVGACFLRVGELSADAQTAPFVKWLFIVPFLLLLGMVMLLSERVRKSPPMRLFLKYMPGGSILDKAYSSLQQYSGHPMILLITWLMSVVVHLFGVVSGYVLVRGMGESPNFGAFLVAWFVANFICSFAPFAGIGVGQVMFGPIFLRIAGVNNGVVLATSLQVTTILAKSPGVIAWLCSRERASQVDDVPVGSAKPTSSLK